MNISLFTSLYNEVLPEVPGVGQDIALNAIRNAAIEFCSRSGCWTFTQDPISSVALQPNYSFEPEAGTEVVGVLQGWYNGLPITYKTAAQLEADKGETEGSAAAGTPWSEDIGIPVSFTIERTDEFILVPMPETTVADAIKMKLAIKPSRTSKGMEKWILDKYYMALAAGAKAKLCAMAGKPWSNPDLHNHFSGIFEDAILSASVINSQTYKLPAMVSDPSPI